MLETRCIISRAQQGQIFDTTTQNSATDTAKSQTALDTTQNNINSFGAATNKFAADNPYVQGGQAETAGNQLAADTAAGQAQAAGQSIQSAAVRTGQNAGGAIAATEEMQQQNERNLIGQEAKMTNDRLASGSTYADAVLGDKAKQEGMQEQLGATEANIAQGQLNTGEDAAKTPSFMDELGQGVISAGTSFAEGFGKALGSKCWIAAELYGGWSEPRTRLIRQWIADEFEKHWYGMILGTLYGRFGESIAEQIKDKRKRWLRAVFQCIFNRALKSAEKWQAVKNGR